MLCKSESVFQFFFVLRFPVIPDETAENNSFMYNIAKGEDWPKLATASPKEMYEGTVRMLMEYGATCLEHMEYLSKRGSFFAFIFLFFNFSTCG